MNYHKKTLNNFGIKVTDDPFPKGYSSDIADIVENLHDLIQDYASVPPSFILEKVIKTKNKYPDIQELYNYLAIAYQLTGDENAEFDIIRETLDRFPNYEFGKLKWAELSLRRGIPQDVPKALGDYDDINQYANEEGFIHFTFYLAFYATYGKYFLAIDKEDKAKECLDKIITYSKESHHAEMLARDIISHRFSAFQHSDKDYNEVSVESKSTYTPEQTNQKPTFIHSEIEVFYQYNSDDLPKDDINKIMSLPRESLIKDLELVLEDGIIRYEWFYHHYEEWNDDEQSAVCHALKFLCALKADESLEQVLNFLRQDEDVLEYWFEDIFYYFKNYLFAISKNNLETLHRFIYEPYVHYMPKSLVLEILSQFYFHNPEHKESFLNIIKEISIYFSETKDKTVFDTDVITALVGVYLDHNLEEFIPFIEKFFDKKWVDLRMFGKKENIIHDIINDDNSWSKNLFPQNIFEDYSGEYQKKGANPILDKTLPKETEVDRFLSNMMISALLNKSKDDDFYDDYEYDDDFYHYEPVETYKREQPKVGRNAPCPCGSGKKYKKCCINL